MSLNIIFKFFAISFSLLYLVYSIVIFQQAKVLTKTLSTGLDKLIIFGSLIQIGFGLLLVVFSLSL